MDRFHERMDKNECGITKIEAIQNYVMQSLMIYMIPKVYFIHDDARIYSMFTRTFK